MEYTFVTGGAGFLGSALIPRLLAKGKNIIVLAHKKSPVLSDRVIVVEGDILEPNLGISSEFNFNVSELMHMAAIHRLGDDPDGSIRKTNVDGTKNVLAFCAQHNINHLYFCSTAYTPAEPRNTYERSKILCEMMVGESDIPRKTIFKPSIVMGTAEHPYPGHFSQFVSLLVKTLHSVGLLKTTVEEKMGLPILQFTLRLKGNPEGKINLITVEAVAEAMATIDSQGTFWLTNPRPPKLKDIVKWVGEFVQFDFRIVREFTPRLLEAKFMKRVSAFEPYLWGDDFQSDLQSCRINREFIIETIKRAIS